MAGNFEIITRYLVMLVEVDRMMFLHGASFFDLNPTILGAFLQSVQLFLNLHREKIWKGCVIFPLENVPKPNYLMHSVQVRHICSATPS